MGRHRAAGIGAAGAAADDDDGDDRAFEPLSSGGKNYITPDGYVQNEGDIGVSTNGPYQISYGSLVPKKGQAGNLLVPVCLSSSHIAYGSIRMEPVFMILGQSAATAAVMAIESKVDVQDLPYEALRKRLVADGQVLEVAKAPAVN